MSQKYTTEDLKRLRDKIKETNQIINKKEIKLIELQRELIQLTDDLQEDPLDIDLKERAVNRIERIEEEFSKVKNELSALRDDLYLNEIRAKEALSRKDSTVQG